MTLREIKYSEEAREKMRQGVNSVSNAVKVTLGPLGRNVVIEAAGGRKPHVTKDGVTVARSMFFADHYENLGAQLLKEVSLKTVEQAGDGTTTATVLAQAMINQGLDLVRSGSNPVYLKRGMDYAVDFVLNELTTHSQPIEKNEELYDVAFISSNGDHHISRILTDAFEAVGRNGNVTLLEGGELETKLEILNGFHFDQGYESTYFVNRPDQQAVVFDNPLIFFTEKYFSSFESLQPIIKCVKEELARKRPLLIISDHVDHTALSTIIQNIQNFPICTVKAPALGDNRKDLLNDLAVITGAKYFKVEDGMRFDSDTNPVTLDHFGRAERVYVTQNKCTIIGGKGDPEKIKERAEDLKKALETFKGDSSIKQEHVVHMISRMGNFNGMAVIRAGGATTNEMMERKDRIEDAMFATKAALDEGILPGGGSPLYHAHKKLIEHAKSEEVKAFNFHHDIIRGIGIVAESIKEPMNLIYKNSSGNSLSEDHARLSHMNEYNEGYDALTDSFCDLMKAGIIDPTKVVKEALKAAKSISGLILTTECVVSISPLEDNKPGNSVYNMMMPM